MKIRRRDLITGAASTALVPAADANAGRRSGLVRAAGGSAAAPPPPPGGTAFVTGFTPDFTTNTAVDGQGIRIVVGGTALLVTALGRMYLNTNSQIHTMSIWYADSHNIPVQLSGSLTQNGATVNVNMAGGIPGQFVYGALSETVVLFPGRAYYIFSSENGTDTYWHSGTAYAHTAVAGGDGAYQLFGGAFHGDGPGGDHGYGLVDFKYVLGAPGGDTTEGSPYGSYFSNDVFLPLPRDLAGNQITVATGTVSFEGQWVHGGIMSGEILTYQWVLDGVAISPVLSSGDEHLPWSCNTVALGIPDGTHSIYPRILDSTLRSVYDRQTQAQTIIVANSGFNNGNQTIPVVAAFGPRAASPLPDYIPFVASNPNPTRTIYPLTYQFIKGAQDPTNPHHADPTPLRSSTLWYGEVACGPRNQEYWLAPGFAGTLGGGVFVNWINPLLPSTVDAAYFPVVFQNSMDGGRLDTWVSPFSNYIEDPAGGGVWWGAEINGRVFRVFPDGSVQTIVGRTRNRAVLNLAGPGVDEDTIEPCITNIGNYPVEFGDLGGANDLCFDPRDGTHKTLYVAAQVDHFIGKVDLNTSPPTMTLYAGTPGTYGFSGNGGPATSCTFNQPSSIIMDGSGTMYVCDSQNSAIRKITSSIVGVPGTITSLCGQGAGPPPPWTSTSGLVGGTTYAVGTGSITWTAATPALASTGVVVMQAPGATTIAGLGATLALNGATGSYSAANTGGSSNIRYVVTAFSDNQNFTIGWEQNDANQAGGVPTLPSGAMTGTLTLTTFLIDTYSSPVSVSFAASYVPYPNVIRFITGGDIIIGESFSDAIRRVHLGSSTITRINCFDNHLENDVGFGWIWLDIDTVGTCGPADDIVIFKLQDAISGAHFSWRMSPVDGYSRRFMGDTGQLASYGPMEEIVGGGGHYPWAVAISKTEGRMIGTGIANFNPVLIRIAQPSDPVVTHGTNPEVNIDSLMIERAKGIHSWGTPNGFPYASRPAFWSVWSNAGNPWTLGAAGHGSWDELNNTYPTDAALGAYIQSGMGGTVARPEMVGNSLRDYIYYIRRISLAGSHPTPVAPGTDDPINMPAMIMSVSAARDTSTQITVSCTTDKPTMAVALAGAPGNYALGVYSLKSNMESSYSTSHSLPVQVLSGTTPVNYFVLVMDQHGNFSRSANHAVA
jgi:hypothetical protein